MLGPALASIGAPEDIGFEVAVLVVVETRVDRVRVVPRRLDIRNINLRRLAREREVLDLPPVLAAVLGHLDQPVVGAGVDQAFHEG